MLLGISDSFPRAMRYFSRKLGDMILMLVEVFHEDLHANYNFVSENIVKKLTMLEEKFQASDIDYATEGHLHKKVQEMAEGFDVPQIGQMIEELIKTNDKIFLLYRNRYIKEKAVKKKL